MLSQTAPTPKRLSNMFLPSFLSSASTSALSSNDQPVESSSRQSDGTASSASLAEGDRQLSGLQRVGTEERDEAHGSKFPVSIVQKCAKYFTPGELREIYTYFNNMDSDQTGVIHPAQFIRMDDLLFE